jgi:uncharacterized flavoprotein (TIGR03862 family)
VEISPLRPANSGFLVSWSDIFRTRFAGQPLKRTRFSFDGEEIRGEAMITGYGLEGGAIYALSPFLRDALDMHETALLEIDLLPDLSQEALAARLSGGGKNSLANGLRKAGLSPVAASILREDVFGAALPSNPAALAERIKGVRIRLTATAPIDRAISTAGGIAWASLNPDFSLVSDPSTFVCGEMLDWEAPTGGYLLQGCFATGRAAAHGALARLRSG